MSIRHIPDPSLDGTVWGTGSLLYRDPDIRFFYCDPNRPRTPSHVWWDGLAFSVEPTVFSRRPDMVMRSDEMRFSFGPLELIADAIDMTLADLEHTQAKIAERGSTP